MRYRGALDANCCCDERSPAVASLPGQKCSFTGIYLPASFRVLVANLP
jgi:hypothetical protein